METTDRTASEEHAINRALQHDLVLHESVDEHQQSIFEWHSARGTIGSRFTDRVQAIDWISDWLSYDSPSGDF